MMSLCRQTFFCRCGRSGEPEESLFLCPFETLSLLTKAGGALGEDIILLYVLITVSLGTLAATRTYYDRHPGHLHVLPTKVPRQVMSGGENQAQTKDEGEGRKGRCRVRASLERRVRFPSCGTSPSGQPPKPWRMIPLPYTCSGHTPAGISYVDPRLTEIFIYVRRDSKIKSASHVRHGDRTNGDIPCVCLLQYASILLVCLVRVPREIFRASMARIRGE